MSRCAAATRASLVVRHHHPNRHDPASEGELTSSTALTRNPWLRKRLIRLARPVAALVAVWIAVIIGMILACLPGKTVHTLLFLVISPLWFLGVYAVLTALTPVAMRLVRRFGAWAAALPSAVVAVTDLVRFGLHGSAWVGWVNVAAGWLVPYLLGIASARGSLRGRRVLR